MVRLSDGDREAFPSLVDDLWPVILAFAQRAVGRESDAEDIAQEVFMRICARISELDRSRDGVSWAFGIASYEIMTHRRRVQRRHEVQGEMLLPELVHPSASQEELLLQREIRAALELAVGALTEDDRRTLGLLEHVAATDVPPATLRKRRQRTLDRLRTLWRSIYGES